MKSVVLDYDVWNHLCAFDCIHSHGGFVVKRDRESRLLYALFNDDTYLAINSQLSAIGFKVRSDVPFVPLPKFVFVFQNKCYCTDVRVVVSQHCILPNGTIIKVLKWTWADEPCISAVSRCSSLPRGFSAHQIPTAIHIPTPSI